MKTTEITQQVHAGTRIELTIIDELLIASILKSLKQLSITSDGTFLADIDLLNRVITLLDDLISIK